MFQKEIGSPELMFEAQSNREAQFWYDPTTGHFGYGKAYGERSFNCLPLGALSGEEARKAFLKANGRRRPFSVKI